MRIEGCAALVAGGASGLGAATVRRLHAAGATVTIADVNADRGDALAAELGERAAFVACDVTRPEQVQAAVEAAGGLRISVCCAGVGWAEKTAGRRGPHAFEPFQTVVAVNLIGTFNVLRLAAAPLLAGLPEEARVALGEQVPHPHRLGRPEEYAQLAAHIVENAMLNGEVIRLDGALRMPPR